MIKHIDNAFSIMWGDAKDFPVSHKGFEFESLCEALRKKLELDQFVFAHQVHGVDGFFWGKDVDENRPLSSREIEGDFVITDRKNVGIGVLTADCLPIIFYFHNQHIVAAVHAGWRGNVANICKVMLEKVQEYATVDVAQIRVFFGPAAKKCCYEVSPDFLEHLNPFACKNDLIEERNGKLFFDNTMLAIKHLENLGIKLGQIDLTAHQCTMCSPGFHSYRKSTDKEMYRTQASIVWLK